MSYSIQCVITAVSRLQNFLTHNVKCAALIGTKMTHICLNMEVISDKESYQPCRTG